MLKDDKHEQWHNEHPERICGPRCKKYPCPLSFYMARSKEYHGWLEGYVTGWKDIVKLNWDTEDCEHPRNG